MAAEINVLKDRTNCRFCCRPVAVDYLREHYFGHFNYKPFVCVLCTSDFSTEHLMVVHCKLKHSNVVNILNYSTEKIDKFINFVVDAVVANKIGVEKMNQMVVVAEKICKPLSNPLNATGVLPVEIVEKKSDIFANKLLQLSAEVPSNSVVSACACVEDVHPVMASCQNVQQESNSTKNGIDFPTVSASTVARDDVTRRVAKESSHMIRMDDLDLQEHVTSPLSNGDVIAKQMRLDDALPVHLINNCDNTGRRSKKICPIVEPGRKKEVIFTARKTMPYSKPNNVATTTAASSLPKAAKRHKCQLCQKDVVGVTSSLQRHVFGHLPTKGIEWLVQCLICPSDNPHQVLYRENIAGHLLENHRLTEENLVESVHYFDRTQHCQEIIGQLRIECFGML